LRAVSCIGQLSGFDQKARGKVGLALRAGLRRPALQARHSGPVCDSGDLIDRGDKLRMAEWLHQNGFGTHRLGDAQAVFRAEVHAASRHRDDADVRLHLPDGEHHLEAVAIRHQDIGDHEVEGVLLEQFDRSFAGGGTGNRVAHELKQALKDLLNRGDIIDNEHGQ
jgi:hypothetical protein